MVEETQSILQNGMESIADGAPYPEVKPDGPAEERTEIGYLIVSAGSGGRAYPLGEVEAEIYLPQDGTWQLYRRTSTDATGASPRLEIPTPKAPTDADEDNPYAPYTLARVRAFREGYYPIEAKEVPIFSGITSLQYFEFIPLSESDALMPPTGSLTAVGEDANASIDQMTPSEDATSEEDTAAQDNAQ